MKRYGLLPELEAWDRHNGGEISPEGWASCVGSYSLAVAYASLLWPEFVENDGMVFRSGVAADHVQQWMNGTTNDKPAVEAMVNHLHVLDVQHPGAWEQANETQVRYLAETLRAAWAAKLAIDFPNKKFVVKVIEGSATELREYQVVFYQATEA